MTSLAYVTVALVLQGERLDRLSRVLTLGAVLLLLAPRLFGFETPMPPRLLLGGAVLAGLGELWFAARVAVDAGLFEALARDGDPAWDELDAALTGLKLMPAEKAGRSPAARCAGAMRLVRFQAAALILQLVLIAGALLV